MSVARLLEEGIAAARAGRRAEARAAFRSVLREDPLNETALLWLAFLSDRPRASLSYIARALEANPDSPRAQAALQWARRQASNLPAPAGQKAVYPPPPPVRSSRLHRTVLGGALVLSALLLIVCAIGWVGQMLPSAQAGEGGMATTASPVSALEPSPTPDALPSAVPTVPPSATPTPTPTTVPTATSVPTATPTPSPTPSPTPTPMPTVPPTATPIPPTPLPPSTVSESRWIDVDLTHQILTAYEGDIPVRTVVVSTGLPRTPTPVGQFRIWVKLLYDDMEGPGYYLRNVPFVMYFYGPYGLHGTYWHNNFGQPMSHGCVNLPTPEAEWLFNWAEVGTLVNIHY